MPPIGNRFDWADALKDGAAPRRNICARRTALRFERVLGAKVQGIDLDRKDAVLSLLAISFEPGEAPGRAT